jgi:predicted O-methyltransferase YrrM
MHRIPQAALNVSQVKGPFSRYLNWHETAILVALVRSVTPRVMIEFGCNLGITAARVLENVPSLERYIGIDVPANHEPILAHQRDEIPLNPGYYAADDERFWLLTAQSTLTPDQLEPCDAAFIDGDHSEYFVCRDTDLARALVRPGGIIVWHDAGNESVEVTPVLEELCQRGWPIQQVQGSWLAFMRVGGSNAD